MSLLSVAVSFFNVSIAIFEKGACQQSASFPQATLCLWILQQEHRSTLAFSQLWNCVTYWNAQTRPAFTVPELLSIVLKNEILKASNFINIRLFSRIFCKKTDFILFFEIFYRVLWSKYCIFSKICLVLRHWHTSSE